jgi:hypothetical protein
VSDRDERREPAAKWRVRLPGFVADEDVGLGDAMKHVSRSLGIRPCAACDERAAQLNQWIVFTRGTAHRR